MITTRTRTRMAVAAAVSLIGFGIVAPAFAEGQHSGRMSKWTSGHAGPQWHDKNLDATNGRVTFRKGCSHDFVARIRREKFGPDVTVGAERINCTSYTDAVYYGDGRADDYHFDVREEVCNPQLVCFNPYLTGAYTEVW